MTSRFTFASWFVGVLVVAGLMLGGLTLVTGAATAQQTGPVAPNQPDDLRSLSVQDISLTQAMAVIDAARQEAEALQTRMDIAIVDRGGNLKAFVRMDDAWLGSIDIAMKKARTARFFDMPTGEIGALSQPGGPLYQIEVSNEGLITFPGGVPLRDRTGAIIGAIGVSGSTVEHDHAVAAAGAAVLERAE